MNVIDQKIALRWRLRQKVSFLAKEQRTGSSDQLLRILAPQPIWKSARQVLLYFPRQDEPDIHQIFRSAQDEGKTVAFPRYNPNAEEYEAAVISDVREDVETGKFGIREPLPRCPALSLKQLDLVLVPGVGFDLLGRRLGRGRGFYDRLLAHATGIKCGVAFDEQLVEEIPVELHDVSLDCILTPTRWHDVAS